MKRKGFLYEDTDFIFIDTCRLSEKGFCTDCSAVTEDFGYTDCPVGFDMCDESCIRHSDVEEVIALVHQADDICRQACRDNRRYGINRG